MVAIYIAGFVILFVVASLLYKASASLVMKGRNRISTTKLADASPVESILLGSSRRLSRSDLLLENLALRQELSVLKAHHPQPQLGTPDKLLPVALAQLEAFPNHHQTGSRRAARSRGQKGNPDGGMQNATNHSPRGDGEGIA